MTNDELSKAIKTEAGKIVAKIDAVLSEVKRLSLNALHVPRHEEGKPDKADDAADKREVKPSLSSGEGIFATLNGADHTKDAKEDPPNKHNKLLDWLVRWKILMEWAGAGVLLAYTLVTYCTLQTIKESNRISTGTLQVSNETLIVNTRAFVAAYKIEEMPDRWMDFTLWIKDSGHIPSRSFAIQMYMDAVSRRDDGNATFYAPLEEHWFRYGGKGTDIPPGVDYPIPYAFPPSFSKYRQMLLDDKAELRFSGYVVYETGFTVPPSSTEAALDRDGFCFMYAHRYQAKLTWAPCDVHHPDGTAERLIDEYDQQQKRIKNKSSAPQGKSK